MNRCGFIFLVSTLLFVAVLLTIMFARQESTELDEASLLRVRTMDEFITDFGDDSRRAAYISGFRALIAIEQYLNDRGEYVDDLAPIFVEAFVNGTIEGEHYAVLDDSTFNDYLANVEERASLVGISLDATVFDVTLSQSTPWSVDVNFLLRVVVNDSRGQASWNYTESFTTEVSIFDLRDPVYSVSTYGKVPNTIRKSTLTMGLLVVGNDTSGLEEEIQNMTYREDPSAPSFLQRIAGDLTGNSTYGIASLVDLDNLDAQGLEVENGRSIVDAWYFSGRNATVYCPDSRFGLATWVRLDSTHYADEEHNYDFDDLNATTCS